MKRRLTDALVRRSTQGDYWDAMVPGFGLRVRASGRKSWVVLAPNRRTIGTYPATDLATARERARLIFGEIEAGRDPFASGDLTVEELFAEYLKRYAEPNHSAAWVTYQRDVLRRSLDVLGAAAATSVDRSDIVRVVDAAATRGGVFGNRTRSVLHRVFSWAVGRGVVEANPVTAVPRPLRRERPRSRVLSLDELRVLFESCREHRDSAQARLLLLRFLTVQRETSIRSMRWSDIEGEKWSIPETKNRDPLIVYLSPEALEVVHWSREFTIPERRAALNTWVFPGRRGHLGRDSQGKARLKRWVGLAAEWEPRDVRRTATTILTERGVSPFVVERVLGHRDRRGVTAIYDRHSYDAEKQEAMLLLGEVYRELSREAPRC